MTSKPEIVTFMVRLHKIVRAGLRARDAMLLYTIMVNPGVNGKDLGRKLGIPERSHIDFGIKRLIRVGFVEDRREEVRKANPNLLYVTPAGSAFWDDLMS